MGLLRARFVLQPLLHRVLYPLLHKLLRSVLGAKLGRRLATRPDPSPALRPVPLVPNNVVILEFVGLLQFLHVGTVLRRGFRGFFHGRAADSGSAVRDHGDAAADVEADIGAPAVDPAHARAHKVH